MGSATSAKYFYRHKIDVKKMYYVILILFFKKTGKRVGRLRIYNSESHTLFYIAMLSKPQCQYLILLNFL